MLFTANTVNQTKLPMLESVCTAYLILHCYKCSLSYLLPSPSLSVSVLFRLLLMSSTYCQFLSASLLLEEHVEESGVEASAGVQEETQALESLPIIKMVSW